MSKTSNTTNGRAFLRNALALFLGIVFAAPIAWTKVDYDADQLRVMNGEKVQEMVRRKIKRAQDIQAKQDGSAGGPDAEPEAIAELRDAMRIVLSRPDQDGARSPAFGRLRRELADMNALDGVLQELASEGVSALQGADTTPRRQWTYVVMLEGLMAEIKPDIKNNEAFRGIIEQIRDANLKISDQLKNANFMRSMSRPNSPSQTAAKILPVGKKK